MNVENEIKMAFDSVRASESLKASTRSFLEEARRKEERKMRRGAEGRRLRMAAQAVCAAMLLLTVGMGGYVLLLVPVSYVSIDVNPSIELELNRIDRVISAKAYNEDGEKILKGISVDGRHYAEAIDLLMESNEMQPYLAENAALTFTVASHSIEREKALLKGVRNCSGCLGHGGMSVRTDLDMVREAHESGLSLGKYSAYRLLQQYDSSISIEDCHHMTMSEIHGLLEEHGHKGDEGHEGGRHWGTGSGDGCTSAGDEAEDEEGGFGGGGSGHGHGHGH